MRNNVSVTHIYYLHKQIKLYVLRMDNYFPICGSTTKIMTRSQVYSSSFYIETFFPKLFLILPFFQAFPSIAWISNCHPLALRQYRVAVKLELN